MDKQTIDIDFEYLSRIRTAFALHTSQKTSNILEGDFRSVYRGRSMEFDELSEYMTGDDVHDIDWKSSSRADKVLVRRYVAERKHYLLFVTDTGKKMLADTSAGVPKSRIAAMTFGTAAYLADRAGADYSLLYGTGDRMELDLFRSGMPHLEKLLTAVVTSIGTETTRDVTQLLHFASEQIKKKMILILITDFDGLAHLDEKEITRLSEHNDLLVVNIDDAYLMGEKTFDTDQMRYADTRIVRTKALEKAERARRKEITDRASMLLRRARAQFVTIAREDEITDRVLELFARR